MKEERKLLFHRQAGRTMFMPTPEEIGKEINTGMKMAQEKGGKFIPEDKRSFIPSPQRGKK